MSDRITVRLAGGKAFEKGLRYAKQFGGTYNPATKTWSIPTHRNGIYNDALNAPHLYGLIPVRQAEPQHDHNCPARFGGACECDVRTGS